VSRPVVGLLIAIFATFSAAPATAFGASNALSQPSVSPTGGPVGTVVMLGVDYSGPHPASDVEAWVGTERVALIRITGTPSQGRWIGVATPPMGTWPVTFTATADRGNQPSLEGPSVTITAALRPSAAPQQEISTAPAATEAPTSSGAPSPASGGGSAVPGIADAAPAAPASSVSTNDPAPVATVLPIASASPAAPIGGNGVADAVPTAASSSLDGRGLPAPSAVFGMPVASGLAATPEQASGGSGAPLPGDGMRGQAAWLAGIVMLGVTMAGILALVSTAIWLAGRRRAQEASERAGRQVASPVADDPIVGALGIPSDTLLRARRARRLRDSLDERAAADATRQAGDAGPPTRRRRPPRR
jgi:hypothetical protein